MTQGFELFAKLGGDASGLQRALGNAQKSVGSAGQSMERLRKAGVLAFKALGVAAAAATAAVVAFARSGLRAVDEQAKLARSVDGTINGLRALQLAAADAGVESGQLGTSMQMLNARLAEAARGTGTAAATMERLGLSASELLELDIDERMAVIADRMRELGFTSAQAQDALSQLGIRNRQLALLFTQGGQAIRGARGEVRDFGLEVSQIDARQVEIANDAFSRVGLVVEGVRDQLAIALSPAILAVSTAFTNMIKEAGGLDTVVEAAVRNSVTFLAGFVDAIHTVRMAFVNFAITLREFRNNAKDTDLELMQLKSHLLDLQNTDPGVRIIQSFEQARHTIRQAAEEAEAALEQVPRLIMSGFGQMIHDMIAKAREGTEEIKGFFDNLLESLDNNFQNMDQIAAGMINNMTARFGDAFEQMVFDSKSLGEAISQLAETMLRSIVNALGQMAAQWVAYQAVQMVKSKASQATSAVTAAATGTAIAAAYAPAAAAASLASFGANAAPAMAALSSTHALSKVLSLGARERGGPVMSGQPYMVGERGPELMVPHGAGRVVPNNQLGGQSTMVTVNINAEDPGAEGRIRTMVERDMAPQIVQAAVGQTLGRLQRPSFA